MIQNLNPEAVAIAAPIVANGNKSTATLVCLPPGYNGKLFVPPSILTPDRVRQSIQVDDVASMIAYLEHQLVESASLAIFVDVSQRKILAVLDYSKSHIAPGHVEHRVSLDVRFSEDFVALYAVLNKDLTQEQFLDFMDRWAHVFVNCAELREVISNFQSVTIQRVTRIVNERNGTGRFVFDSTEEQGAEMRLPPRELITKMAIFFGGQEVEIGVQVRYKTASGQLRFVLLIPGLEAILRQQMERIEGELRDFCETEKGGPPLIVRGPIPKLLGIESLPDRIDVNGGALPQGLNTTETDQFLVTAPPTPIPVVKSKPAKEDHKPD